MQQSYRGLRGMQVHAVPDNEKAFDASGRKLPWGYELAAGESREPQEKGPFGRSQRRSRSGLSRSRSRTAEPRREEERLKAEQAAAEEAVFGNLRKVNKEESRRDALGEVDGNAVSQSTAQIEGAGEATEVALYGFGEDFQWAAIDFYERVSGGGVLEDYDRQPAGRRYDISRSLSRATSQRSLTKAALKMKNRYAGGNHWIKVTFDSRGAAEVACARSPHIIKGHLVYAEPFLGRGPGKDEPIPATNAGAQITDSVLPASFSTNALNISPGGSTTTATSATATSRREETISAKVPKTSDDVFAPNSQRPSPTANKATSSPQDQAALARDAKSSENAANQQSMRRRTVRIEGATAAVVLPASAAMLPKQPRQSWGVRLGTGDVIGSTVPKRSDGSFDWEIATLYWRIFYFIDKLFGTDLCGLKAD